MFFWEWPFHFSSCELFTALEKGNQPGKPHQNNAINVLVLRAISSASKCSGESPPLSRLSCSVSFTVAFFLHVFLLFMSFFYTVCDTDPLTCNKLLALPCSSSRCPVDFEMFTGALWPPQHEPIRASRGNPRNYPTFCVYISHHLPCSTNHFISHSFAQNINTSC